MSDVEIYVHDTYVNWPGVITAAAILIVLAVGLSWMFYRKRND